jgi:hypothetical protein
MNGRVEKSVQYRNAIYASIQCPTQVCTVITRIAQSQFMLPAYKGMYSSTRMIAFAMNGCNKN